MKKLVIFLLVILLAFGGYLTWLSYQPEQHMAITDEAIPAYDGAMSAEAAEALACCLDYDAIRALYADDKVVMTVQGRDVTWAEYYSWFYMNAMQVESFFEQMAMYYGVSASWDGSVGDGSGMVYADLPAFSTEETFARFAAIEALAAQKGVELSAESAAELEDEALAQSVMGEDASIEDLVTALEEMAMDLESYRRITAVNFLYGDMLAAEFGADFELVDAAALSQWLEEQGYMCANHILFMTMNKDTGEKLDESAAVQKKAQADAVYAELSAIESVDALLARFAELKEEYCEDTGKAAYPNGYTFVSGTMVSEFENAVVSSADYQVSEPVESSYGYHIIMRLPLGAESLISDANGSMVPAGSVYAQQLLNAEVEELIAKGEILYADDFTAPNVMDYIID